jgi:hypothetical protein
MHILLVAHGGSMGIGGFIGLAASVVTIIGFFGNRSKKK